NRTTKRRADALHPLGRLGGVCLGGLGFDGELWDGRSPPGAVRRERTRSTEAAARGSPQGFPLMKRKFPVVLDVPMLWQRRPIADGSATRSLFGNRRRHLGNQSASGDRRRAPVGERDRGVPAALAAAGMG